MNQARTQVRTGAARNTASYGVMGASMAIRLYQRCVSPLLTTMLGVRCRFEPSCSCYAHQALQTHGFVRGSLMAAWRFARCNPFGGSGHDPVPPATTSYQP